MHLWGCPYSRIVAIDKSCMSKSVVTLNRLPAIVLLMSWHVDLFQNATEHRLRYIVSRRFFRFDFAH